MQCTHRHLPYFQSTHLLQRNLHRNPLIPPLLQTLHLLLQVHIHKQADLIVLLHLILALNLLVARPRSPRPSPMILIRVVLRAQLPELVGAAGVQAPVICQEHLEVVAAAYFVYFVWDVAGADGFQLTVVIVFVEQRVLL